MVGAANRWRGLDEPRLIASGHGFASMRNWEASGQPVRRSGERSCIAAVEGVG
jgi:hypothetical protein